MSKPQPATEIDRKELYDSMPAELQQVANRIDLCLSRESGGTMEIRRRMGELVRQVMNDKKSTYGSGAVEKLGRYFGNCTSLLYELAEYATAYSHDEIENLGSRKMSDGGNISYSHLTLLMQVRDAAARHEAMEQVFASSLSVRELANQLAATGAIKVDARRRKKQRRRSRSPQAGLLEMTTESRRMAQHLEGWQTGVFGELDEAPPETFSPDLLGGLQTAIADLDKLRGAVDQGLQRLRANLDRAQKILSNRKKSATSPAPEGAGGSRTPRGRQRRTRRQGDPSRDGVTDRPLSPHPIQQSENAQLDEAPAANAPETECA